MPNIENRHRAVELGAVFTLLFAGCHHERRGDGIPVTMTLTATVRSPSQVDLDWTAHPGSVTGYDPVHNGVGAWPVHIMGTSFPDRGLEPDTSYRFVVYAVAFPLGIVGRSNELTAATPALAPWIRTTLDSTAGSHVALALDGAERVHVSYRDTMGLVYATNASGSWVQTIVDPAGAADGDTAIAVTPGGDVHVGYCSDTTGSLVHATNSSGPWVTTVVDPSCSGAIALASDSANRLHVTYASGWPVAQLMYATNATGPWTTEVLPDSSVTDASIAIDDGDAVHIAWSSGDSQNGIMHYLTNRTGSWSGGPVAEGVLSGSALAIDAGGRPHVCYATMAPGFALVHATYAGSWTGEQVDAFDWFPGSDRSLAFDGANHAHLLYTDHNGDLVHRTAGSGSWSIDWVDACSTTYCAFGVSASGRVHVAYSAHAGMHQLRYAAD